MGRKKKSRARQQLLQKIEASKQNQMEKKRKHEENEKIRNKKKRCSWYRNRQLIRKLKKYNVTYKKATPHPLIIIDDNIFEKIKDNTIILHEMDRKDVDEKNCTDGGITQYKIHSCGRNILHIFHNNDVHDTHFAAVENKYLVVVCKATEHCLCEDSNIFYTTNNIKSTDYVLLLLCVFGVETSQDFMWDNMKDLKCLRKMKKSTVKGTDIHHYGSSGQCFSFGLRNSFVTDANNISITTYAGDRQFQIRKYKDFIWSNIASVYKAFDCIIGGVSNKLNLSCRSMMHMAYNTPLSDYLPFNQRSSQSYIFSGFINVNARTRHFHCEKDTTYTTIYVPKQKDKGANITFQFQINESFLINIIAHQQTCFTYSAYCLAHRQLKTEGTNCMNISTYSGKRVFCNYRKSYHRVKKNR